MTKHILTKHILENNKTSSNRKGTKHILGFPVIRTIMRDELEQIPWGVQKINSERVWNECKSKGKEIKIAIIDTGIDKNHPDLKANVKGGINLIEKDDPDDYLDDNGHGCCHPNTNIFTTFCGINKIKDFYDRIDSEETLNDNGSFTKLIKDNVFTLSYSDNNIDKKKIKSVHKIPINQSDLVQINDILLTPWHKCFVFNSRSLKIEEKRADNIKIYDYLISPGHYVELNTEYRTDENFLIEEGLSYLLGVITGNGHVQLKGNSGRIDLSISDIGVINKCIVICNKFNFNITDHGWQERGNYYRLIIYDKNLAEYVHKNIKTLSVNAKIPDVITKSSINVIISFLSGLIDTDGNVKDGGTRIRISSSSKELISRLYKLLSVLGQQPYVVDIKDKNHIFNGRMIVSTTQNYQVSFHIENIGTELLKYMACEYKKNSIVIKYNKNNIIPITEKVLKDHITSKYGIKFDSYTHRCKCCGKIRLAASRDIISKSRFMEVFEVIDKNKQKNLSKDDYFYNLAKNFNFTLVENIKKKEFNGFFYDLTMEESNNYVAGFSDMIFIHNTHLAGVIAALANQTGIIGVSPEASLYGVKCLDSEGIGEDYNIIAGINWCVENNMDIINMSFGDKETTKAEKDALDSAAENGVVLVAAAGNSGVGKDTMDYPAKYSNVISVGATDKKDKRASFSSTGPGLEVMAPGVDILSTTPGSYFAYSGTSMACPHVVGEIALLLSYNSELRNSSDRVSKIRQIIDMSSVHLGVGEVGNRNLQFGFGRVDAEKALDCLKSKSK